MNDSDKRYELTEEDGIPVIRFRIYFEGEKMGPEISVLVQSLLEKKQTHIIMDFAACPVVNSVAFGVLLKTGALIVDDFQGRLLLTGATGVLTKVFETAGVTVFGEIFPTVPAAIKSIRAAGE